MIVQPGDVVIDYATTITAPALLKRAVDAGVKAVVRYISVKPDGRSDVRPAEAEAIHAAGLGLLVVFEELKTSSLSGAPVGETHGEAARRNLLLLGYPYDVPIIVTVQDVGISRSEYKTVIEYTRAFQDAVQWPAGLILYAGTNVGEEVLHWTPGGILGLWTPAAASWSSNGARSHVLVEQKLNVRPELAGLGWTVDDNNVTQPIKVWSAEEMMKLVCWKGSGSTVYIIGPDGFKSPSPSGDVFFTPDYLAHVEYFPDPDHSGLMQPFRTVPDAVLAGVPDRPVPATPGDVAVAVSTTAAAQAPAQTLTRISLEGTLS